MDKDNLLKSNSFNKKPKKDLPIETTSFLRTFESSELDINSNNNNQDKEIEEIVSKYLNLKKKFNTLWNKID